MNWQKKYDRVSFYLMGYWNPENYQMIIQQRYTKPFFRKGNSNHVCFQSLIHINMENSPIIKIDNLIKRFPNGKTEFTALKNVNLSFMEGEFAGLVGPSGSGKTTLLNIIGSLDTPSDGTATVIDKSISELTNKQSARLRNRHIGFIFQTYNLLPVYSVYENVEFALLLQHMPASERRKAVMEALDWVGLADKVKSRPSAFRR